MIKTDTSFCSVMYAVRSVVYDLSLICLRYTPNANMADRSVGAWDESNEIEASQALMFCFDNAFAEKTCFLGPYVSPSLRVFVFLNATAIEWNLPQ